jgi:hypothetical protein
MRAVALTLLLVQVAKNLLDPVLVRDRFVEPELELRNPTESQAAADLPAEKWRRPLQRPRGFLPGLSVAERGVEHAGHLQVG